MKLFRLLGIISVVAFGVAQPAAGQEGDGEKHWRELREQSREFQSRHNYAEAIRLAEEAVREADEVFGKAHTNYAITVNDLANLHRLVYVAARTQYQNSAPLYETALSILEKNLGRDDAKVAIVLNNLASLYSERGEFEAAEKAYLRTIEIWQKKFGISHPNLAVIWNNLANLYNMMGRPEQAIQAAQQAVLLVNGAQDNALVTSIQGRLAQASDLGRKPEEKPKPQADDPEEAAAASGAPIERIEQELLWTLNGLESALGPDHPNLVPVLKDLGIYYETRSRFERAEGVYTRALAILANSSERAFAREGEILNRLGNLYLAQLMPWDAERIFLEAIEANTRAFGPSHQAVGFSLKGLGDASLYNELYAQAAAKYKQALSILEVSLGRRNMVYEEVRANLQAAEQKLAEEAPPKR